MDDGDSYPPGPQKTLTFTSAKGELRLSMQGDFNVVQKLQDITVLGISTRPHSVTLDSKAVTEWSYDAALNKMVIKVNVNLNRQTTLRWR